MTIRIDGTNTAANPGITGTDTDTGLQFGTDEVNIVTGGSTRATVDSSGRLLVGTSSARSDFFNGAAPSQFQTEIAAAAGLVNASFVNNGGGAGVIIGRSNGSSVGSNTIVSAGDSVGYVDFQAADGTNFEIAARIEAYIDGTPGNNDMPGRLVFSTTADGASSPTERMRIRADGQIVCVATYDNTTANAANVHIFTDKSLGRSTSSIKYKENVEDLQDIYADAILNCRPVWYKSKCTNDNPDWGYWGFIAEEVEQVDPRLCHYGADENGDQVVESVQYDRFVPHLLNLIKRQKEAIEALETRVAQLEGGTN